MRSGEHLVLGGSGFIGRQVALILARRGHRVVVAGRTNTNEAFPNAILAPEIHARLSWVRLDLETADWDRVLGGVEVVHHYAWSTTPASANADPARDLSGNVAATLALLEAMRRRPRPPRLVFASSGGTVYGRLQTVPVSESHPLAPISAYGAAKAALELYLGYYRSVHGLDCRIGRLANPFGAGQNFARGQGAVTTFLHQALIGAPVSIWGDGETVRDYIHVEDAAAGMVALALATRSPAQPWIFNIASGRGVSLNQIIVELETQLGREIEIRYQPGRSFDVPVSILDVSLARDELGWSPAVSFSDGVAAVLGDFASLGGFRPMPKAGRFSLAYRNEMPTSTARKSGFGGGLAVGVGPCQAAPGDAARFGKPELR